MKLPCLAILIVIFGDFFASGLPTFVNEDGQIGFDDQDQLHPNHHTHPKKRSTGKNSPRSLGFNSKNKKKDGAKKSAYPWDSTKASQKIRMEPSDRLKTFAVEGEEPFPETIYDDYDFEFPKGMVLNGHFELKVTKTMEIRMAQAKKKVAAKKE